MRFLFSAGINGFLARLDVVFVCQQHSREECGSWIRWSERHSDGIRLPGRLQLPRDESIRLPSIGFHVFLCWNGFLGLPFELSGRRSGQHTTRRSSRCRPRFTGINYSHLDWCSGARIAPFRMARMDSSRWTVMESVGALGFYPELAWWLDVSLDFEWKCPRWNILPGHNHRRTRPTGNLAAALLAWRTRLWKSHR